MFALYSSVEVISGVAISLGVGASTFAIIFFFMAMKDPSRFETGRPYQRVTYIILRVAMVFILLAEATKAFLIVYSNSATWTEYFSSDYILFIWTLIFVLFANAILMTTHLISMKLGPAIQATSWYTLGVITALPIVGFTYLPLLFTFLGCILFMAAFIEYMRQKLQTPKPEPHEEKHVEAEGSAN